MNARGFLTARCLLVYAVLYLLFIYAPILLLPIFAFNDSPLVAFPLKGFTSKWFEALWTADALHAAIANSVFVAATTACLSTILGVCTARAIARYRFPLESGIIGVLMLPLILPEILIAVGLLFVMLQMGLSLSLWTVILGHVLVSTPFTTAILISTFVGVDRSLEEASLDLGETHWGTLRRVTLPLVMPGIFCSLLIGFTISLDEFLIAFFLTGTDITLPVYIWSQLRFPGRLPTVMALGTIMFVMSIILFLMAEWFRHRVRKGQGAEGSASDYA